MPASCSATKPWDTSAGVLVAREAGARVLDHDGTEHSQQSHSTIAVTPALETDLMAAVQAALAELRRRQRRQEALNYDRPADK